MDSTNQPRTPNRSETTSSSGDHLAHYGVPGMKWGSRKLVGKSTTKPSSDHKTYSSLKGKTASELSNDELRKLNDRAQLLDKHRKMNPTRADKVKKAGKAAMGAAGTGVALYGMVKGPAGKAAINFGRNAVAMLLQLYGPYKDANRT